MIVGVRGPGVLLSARTCAFLEQYAVLASLRTAVRGQDDHLADQLSEIRQAAEQWSELVASEHAHQLGSDFGSDRGTRQDEKSEPVALSTREVGVLLGVSSRAVVKAIARDELRATRERPGTAWRIAPDAVEHYRQATTGRNHR